MRIPGQANRFWIIEIRYFGAAVARGAGFSKASALHHMTGWASPPFRRHDRLDVAVCRPEAHIEAQRGTVQQHWPDITRPSAAGLDESAGRSRHPRRCRPRRASSCRDLQMRRGRPVRHLVDLAARVVNEANNAALRRLLSTPTVPHGVRRSR
jgi:hypothetical protein